MVTAADIGLRVMEATAILLPLLGIFMQIFMSRIASEESNWSNRQILVAYAAIAFTAFAIVIAGAAAILPFLSGDNPISILLPLGALYIGYFGIALTIAVMAAGTIQSVQNEDESVEQVLLSSWGSKEENE